MFLMEIVIPNSTFVNEAQARIAYRQKNDTVQTTRLKAVRGQRVHSSLFKDYVLYTNRRNSNWWDVF